MLQFSNGGGSELKTPLNFSMLIKVAPAIEIFQKLGESEVAKKMAGAAGLEPVTSAVTGQRSNQLSYAPAWGGKR